MPPAKPLPVLATLEEFCKYYDKNDNGSRQLLYDQYLYAVKEKKRCREKTNRCIQRKRKEKEEYLEKHPEERKKPGRPRIYPLPTPPPPAPPQQQQ